MQLKFQVSFKYPCQLFQEKENKMALAASENHVRCDNRTGFLSSIKSAFVNNK